MSVDQGIGLVAIIVAVILGIFAAKKIISRNRSQAKALVKAALVFNLVATPRSTND